MIAALWPPWQVEAGLKVLVQPSDNRIFPNGAYEEAGGVLAEDISEASVILAVKEVPIEKLIANRTYCFFSHTKKAQPANMPLMDAILEKNIRLVDYECITEGGIRNGKRLVAFGKFAGDAPVLVSLPPRGLVLSCSKLCASPGVQCADVGVPCPGLTVCVAVSVQASPA